MCRLLPLALSLAVAYDEMSGANRRLIARAVKIQDLKATRYFSLIEPGELDPSAPLWLLSRNGGLCNEGARRELKCWAQLWPRATVEGLAGETESAAHNLTRSGHVAHCIGAATFSNCFDVS